MISFSQQNNTMLVQTPVLNVQSIGIHFARACLQYAAGGVHANALRLFWGNLG